MPSAPQPGRLGAVQSLKGRKASTWECHLSVLSWIHETLISEVLVACRCPLGGDEPSYEALREQTHRLPARAFSGNASLAFLWRCFPPLVLHVLHFPCPAVNQLCGLKCESQWALSPRLAFDDLWWSEICRKLYKCIKQYKPSKPRSKWTKETTIRKLSHSVSLGLLAGMQCLFPAFYFIDGDLRALVFLHLFFSFFQ